MKEFWDVLSIVFSRVVQRLFTFLVHTTASSKMNEHKVSVESGTCWSLLCSMLVILSVSTEIMISFKMFSGLVISFCLNVTLIFKRSFNYERLPGTHQVNCKYFFMFISFKIQLFQNEYSADKPDDVLPFSNCASLKHCEPGRNKRNYKHLTLRNHQEVSTVVTRTCVSCAHVARINLTCLRQKPYIGLSTSNSE